LHSDLSWPATAVAVLALAINVKAAALLAFHLLPCRCGYGVADATDAQNIVIGDAAGTIPWVIGWAAAVGKIGFEPLIRFLIIFL
jgi:heme o synthase